VRSLREPLSVLSPSRAETPGSCLQTDAGAACKTILEGCGSVFAACFRVLQCVAVCCRCVAGVQQCVAEPCSNRFWIANEPIESSTTRELLAKEPYSGRMWQCVCSVLQGVAVCCSVLQVCNSVLQSPVRTGFGLQTSPIESSRKRCIAHCNTLQHTATHCNTLPHTAALCNMLQHAATRCSQ